VIFTGTMKLVKLSDFRLAFDANPPHSLSDSFRQITFMSARPRFSITSRIAGGVYGTVFKARDAASGSRDPQNRDDHSGGCRPSAVLLPRIANQSRLTTPGQHRPPHRRLRIRARGCRHPLPRLRVLPLRYQHSVSLDGHSLPRPRAMLRRAAAH
jgi:hypothetical protein